MPLGLAALAFVLALVQRPGWATSDTKIDLHVDPAGFLADVASVWTPSGALGHVQGGQYSGYLFPMGPFFALGHLLGIADWVVGRLWLGLLIALAAWGVVRLLDALLGPERGVAHVVAGVLIVLNPYVVVFSNQTSVTLLGYAALPWLLLIVHRGLRNPRGWWWPAALALLFTCIGGGVNAAVVAWLIPAALLMALHEPLRGYVPWRALPQFGVRAIPLALAASLWWVVPVLVQSGYGIDFLKFTEQQGAIWSTTGLSEALRLMSYWISYVGVGFGAHPEPYFSDSATLLFDLPVVLASLLVPALALTGFVWTRRWRYGPFFLAMVLVGLVTMTVGFPEGTPLRSAANFTYNHVAAVQFLRTTYKAAPMVALGLACLGGVAAARAWARLAVPGRRVPVALAGALLVALAAWPLVSGQAVERKLSWKSIPSAWRQAASDLESSLPPNTRAVVLPGQLFSFYRWGGTVDPILPALTDKPVAVRSIVPYADLRSIDLLWTADTLLQQQRALPGQLRPLLGLMGAGAVVSGTDDDRNRSGAMPAAEAAEALRGQGLGAPAVSYGPVLGFRPSTQMLGPTVRLPQVRRYDVGSGARGLVRLESAAGGGTVVDGSAQALAALASFGALPRAGSPSFYAADRTAAQIRSAAEVVVSDSNRRRSFLSSQLQGDVGPTVAATESLSVDAAALNPFPAAGTDGQTVAAYTGAAYLRAPLSPQFTQFPEHRPFAALDGDPRTSWLADPEIDKSRRWIEIGFERERAVDHVDLLPHDDSRAQVTAVNVAGRRFAVHPGWNRIELRLPAVRTLRVTIVGVRQPPDLPRGAGGFDEIRVPGLALHERLRPPVLATRALAAGPPARPPRLTYLFDRTTADQPLRTGSVVNDAQLRSRLDRQDPEPLLARVFDVPRATRLAADSWTSINPRAPDAVVDRLAGYRGPAGFSSSSRFDGIPGYRASGAFDGDPARGWIGTWIPGRPAWLGWRSPRPTTIRSLRLTRLAAAVRFPSRVRVVAGGVSTPPLKVGARGEVRLPRPLRSRSFRIDVLDAVYPPGGPRAERGRRAVGVADVVGGPVARVPRSGPAHFTCGAARIRLGGRTLRLRPRATVEQLDAGAAIRAKGCDGGATALPRGAQQLAGLPGPVRVDHVMLRSPAPAAAAPASAAAGRARVVDPGTFGRSHVDGVRLAGADGHWLVLGESYNRGWRAYCGDRSLGAPQAIDGFANGWLVRGSCPRASFRFAPQRAVQWGYVISGIACLILLAFLLVRRRRRGPAEALDPWLPERDGARALAMPLARAAAIALPAALLLAFLFAIRAGPPAWLGLTVILWRGIGARALTLAAGALLVVVVPVLYVLFPGPDRGGFNPEYAVKHLGAHWVAVAAYVLLAAALARALSTASRASGARRGGRAA